MRKVSYAYDQERDEKVNRSSEFLFGDAKVNQAGVTSINFKGKFSFEMLYKLIHEQLAYYGYKDVDGAGDKIEHYYYECPNPSGGKNEVIIWWRTKKEAPDGNDFFNYRMDIDFQILGLKKDVFVKDGNKFKTDFGELILFIKPRLETAFNNPKSKKVWTNGKFVQMINPWFKDRVFIDQVDERKDELYKHFNAIYAAVKQYLGLENFSTATEPFAPNKGVPQYKI